MKRHDVVYNRKDLCDLLECPHDATDAKLSEKLEVPCGARLETLSFGVGLGACNEVFND